jgi:hypothetical protein
MISPQIFWDAFSWGCWPGSEEDRTQGCGQHPLLTHSTQTLRIDHASVEWASLLDSKPLQLAVAPVDHVLQRLPRVLLGLRTGLCGLCVPLCVCVCVCVCVRERERERVRMRVCACEVSLSFL